MKAPKTLKGLAHHWERESKRAFKRATKIRPHAGHSTDIGGTGDEGWTELIELSERAVTLELCAKQLRGMIK